jgi:hypothetical protein
MVESKKRKQHRALLAGLQVTVTQLVHAFEMRRLSYAEMRAVLHDIEIQARSIRSTLIDDSE